MRHVVRNHFDGLSSPYNEQFEFHRSGSSFCFNTRRKLARELANNISGSILDVACGSGNITSDIVKIGSFKRLVASDISSEMLLNARNHIDDSLLDVQYFQSDVFDLDPSIIGSNFNLILCLGLIAHTGDLVPLLTKLKSLLSPQHGKILLQSSVLDHPGVRLTRRFTEKRHFLRTGYDLTYYTLNDLYSSFAQCELKILDQRSYSLGIPFGDRLSPLINYYLERLFSLLPFNAGSEVLFLLEYQ